MEKRWTVFSLTEIATSGKYSQLYPLNHPSTLSLSLSLYPFLCPVCPISPKLLLCSINSGESGGREDLQKHTVHLQYISQHCPNNILLTYRDYSVKLCLKFFICEDRNIPRIHCEVCDPFLPKINRDYIK